MATCATMCSPMEVLAYASWNGVTLAAFGPTAANKPEWDAYMEFLRRESRPKPRALIFASRSALEHYQRRDLEHLAKTMDRDQRIAVVTSSTFVRGFTKALSLVEPGYRGYSPAELESAFEYLQIPRHSFREVERLFNELRTRVNV
jgi:hypothetical protein